MWESLLHKQSLAKGPGSGGFVKGASGDGHRVWSRLPFADFLDLSSDRVEIETEIGQDLG